MVTNSYNSSSFLVIRLSSLGDILLTTPALRCLRKTFPAARIDVLVKNRYRELLEENPHVSSLISPAEPISWESLKEMRASLEGHYSTVVDLTPACEAFTSERGYGQKKSWLTIKGGGHAGFSSGLKEICTVENSAFLWLI